MKTLKPIMFVIAGMAIAFLVSFKSQEPAKEIVTVNYNPNKKTLIVTGIEQKTYYAEKFGDELAFVNTLNNLSKEGWSIKACDNNVGLVRVYLERTKP